MRVVAIACGVMLCACSDASPGAADASRSATSDAGSALPAVDLGVAPPDDLQESPPTLTPVSGWTEFGDEQSRTWASPDGSSTLTLERVPLPEAYDRARDGLSGIYLATLRPTLQGPVARGQLSALAPGASTIVDLPAGTALRVEYPGYGGEHTVEFLLPGDDELLRVRLTGPGAQAAALGPLADRVAATLGTIEDLVP